MTEFICAANEVIWGIPALILILAVGILLSVRTGWVQFRLFPCAIRTLFNSFKRKKEKSPAGVSGFQALCTALAATVGTGNIAGVAGAIAIGGPGAIFWMWICGFLGMATKFTEATLAVRYRVKQEDGTYVGGPMHIVRQGMGKKWNFLALLYCFFGVTAAFGVGSATQVNALLDGVNGAVAALGGQESKYINSIIGILLSIFMVYSTFGGMTRISEIASFLVPFASVFYMFLCVGVLIHNFSSIPGAFAMILTSAFRPAAITGGIIGSIFQAVRVGASRGVFTNEAGMGTAGIAHASACVRHPVQQGMMGIVEVFLDTIVICTMTALVILCSGIDIPYGRDLGIRIATEAFTSVYGKWVNIPLAFALCSFAVATMLGWGLYGIRCAQFIFGVKACKGFGVLQGASVVAGSLLNTGTVWALSEMANGLMAIPNLIILACFCGEAACLTKEYQMNFNRKNAVGGTYENINQCKSLRTFSNEKISSLGCKSRKGRKGNLSS